MVQRLLPKKCEIPSRVLITPETAVPGAPPSLSLEPIRDDLADIENTLTQVSNNTEYEHTIRQYDFDGMSVTQRGGLYTLKGLAGMNTTRYIGIPEELQTNGLHILKISFFFVSNNPKDITFDALPSHPYNGSYIETLYSVAVSTALSIVLTFGKNFEYTRLQKLRLTTVNGISAENVFFIITLKSIIPKENF